MKVGHAQLSIDTAEKQLQITLTPDKEGTYEPGETVTYNIRATKVDGKPVQAEVALNLVDLSLLTLAEQRGSLLDQFWRERGLGVNTAANLTLSVDRINRLIEELKRLTGGVIYGHEMPSHLTSAIDSIRDNIPKEALEEEKARERAGSQPALV